MGHGIGANMSISGHQRLQAAFDKLVAASRDTANQEIKAALLEIQATADREVSGSGSGHIYKRRGVTHQASAPFQPPASDQGDLKKHIHAAEAIQVYEGEVYGTFGPRDYPVASYLEFGTSKMAPRPFLFPAYQQCLAGIIANFKKALKKLEDLNG